MQTVTVSTKEAFEKAVNSKAEKIIVTGNFAQKIISTQNKKSIGKKIGIGGAIVAGAAAVAGVIAAPFTGGASAVAGVICAKTAATVGAATITLSTVDFIALLGAALGAIGISANVINTITKNYNIKVSAGSTTVECTKK